MGDKKGVGFNVDNIDDKLKNTVLIFVYAAAIFAVIREVSFLFSPFFVISFSIVGSLSRIISTMVFYGAIHGVLFYFLYDNVIHPVCSKIPLIGRSIFTLYFVPLLILYVLLSPLMAFGGAMVSITAFFTGGAGLTGYVIFQMVVSIIISLIGGFIFAKFLDKRLSEYYIW